MNKRDKKRKRSKARKKKIEKLRTGKVKGRKILLTKEEN